MKKKTLAIGTMILAGCLVLSMSGIALAAGITESRAEEIALEHAGETVDELIYISTKLDYDDGRKVYDVEFLTEDLEEYDYEISAATGDILDMDYEAERLEYDRDLDRESRRVRSRDNDKDGRQDRKYRDTVSSGKSSQASDIGEEKAKEIALEKAGLKASEADFIKLKKDYDDGRYVYEGEILAGRTEYEFEICAETGRVLDFEIDR